MEKMKHGATIPTSDEDAGMESKREKITLERLNQRD